MIAGLVSASEAGGNKTSPNVVNQLSQVTADGSDQFRQGETTLAPLIAAVNEDQSKRRTE